MSMRLPVLRLGVVGGDAAALEAFSAGLGARVGLPVTGVAFGHYAELLDAMHDGAIELAWLPPVVAVRAQARGRTLPIALPVRGGASEFFAALFAPASSPLKTLEDVVGARVAWVDKQSAAGYVVVRAELRAKGVDFAKAFASERFCGTHQAVADAVSRGEADVGATFVYLEGAAGTPPERRRVVRGGWGEGPLSVRLLALAGPIPVDVMAASIRVPVALIRAVQRALTGDRALVEAARPLFHADAFVDATPDHLQPLAALLEHLVEDPRHLSSHPPPRG